jgi:hypothetical protein
MAQLTNPLSVGRYWIDLIGPDRIGRFVDFTRNPTLGPNVKVLHSEHHEAVTSLIPGTEDQPEREWVLFGVLAPVFWDYDFYGTPNVAGPEIQEEADTIQSPSVEDMSLVPDFRGIGQGIENAIKTGVVVVTGTAVAVGLVWLLTNVLRKKSR